MVLMVSVAVTAAVPEMAAGAVTEHVGGSSAPTGLEVTAHVIATVPVKPPLGVIVMVELAVAPGDAMVIGGPLSVKAGGTATVIATIVVSATPAELPVTVAV
jgi:hypothetical protein